jgi:hypothetical protein
MRYGEKIHIPVPYGFCGPGDCISAIAISPSEWLLFLVWQQQK